MFLRKINNEMHCRCPPVRSPDSPDIMSNLRGKVMAGPLAGYLAILGGFLLHLTLGTLYCFGNMNTYMTSYLRTHVSGQVR